MTEVASKTPASVQEAFLLLLNRVVSLEEKVANLEEQLKRNSGNSSQPPKVLTGVQMTAMRTDD